jgi:hypothetical protein
MKRSLAAALAATALAVTGCSVGAPKRPQTNTTGTGTATAASSADAPPPRYITDAQLRKLHSDSPEHTFMEFWQAAQFKNLLIAYDLLGKDFRSQFAGSLPRFSQFVSADFQHWLVAQPKILSVNTSGSSATAVISYRPPGGLEDRSMAAFVRERGKWRIAFYFYLANRLRGQ